MTIREQLIALRERAEQLRRTPCATCGHPYIDHTRVGHQITHGCYFPRIAALHPKTRPCRCRQFIEKGPDV